MFFTLPVLTLKNYFRICWIFILVSVFGCTSDLHRMKLNKTLKGGKNNVKKYPLPSFRKTTASLFPTAIYWGQTELKPSIDSSFGL